ncbi:TlpA disulfide reductase family protein [Tenacibaculum sp. IB213877]|uniref:TlpA family protein disulfide reductase n=1 Tax=Tenacibaculum sp. IB213877 TaxID=3097351 RepID=UPI002A5A5C86|nr:TlpA disulfide reductase family protein [Tenacibaculum sp. IB213877]MDY0780311.1 TlpA disulfide reductase family protein [Tenacibaculum sp. IB213877]
MKSILISILLITVSFLGTFFIIEKISKKSTVTITTNNMEENDADDVDVIIEEKKVIENSVDIKPFTNSPEAWENYYKQNIDLSTDFLPLNQEGIEIDKEQFLSFLKTGDFIPVKINDEIEIVYQLQKPDNSVNSKILKSIKSNASLQYVYFMKEGRDFPMFDFVDLNGNNYTNKNTKDKITVIKCWFINCKVCVEEFPQLNDLYDKYEGYENVIFISLAFDTPDKLKKFLAKKEFRYPVVAEQKDFMNNQIGVKQYPTHIILNQDGKIFKMVNNVDSLIFTLDELLESSGEIYN